MSDSDEIKANPKEPLPGYDNHTSSAGIHDNDKIRYKHPSPSEIYSDHHDKDHHHKQDYKKHEDDHKTPPTRKIDHEYRPKHEYEVGAGPETESQKRYYPTDIPNPPPPSHYDPLPEEHEYEQEEPPKKSRRSIFSRNMHNRSLRRSTSKSTTKSDLLLYILAVFVPPAAVYLKSGCDKHFVVNVILSIICCIPGVLHAWWVIARYDRRQRRKGGVEGVGFAYANANGNGDGSSNGVGVAAVTTTTAGDHRQGSAEGQYHLVGEKGMV